jgi:DNA-binding response OmpR family regulator
MKILLIEDEKALAASIASYLKKENSIVETAYTFEEAISKAGINVYDCILVDLMLPDGNGLDIIRELKQGRNETGIIITSAKDSLDDKLTGLDTGADDYLTKPFHLAELNARIKSLIRRKQHSGDIIIRNGEIEVNTSTSEVHINSEKVDLTRKEYELLVFFLSNRGRVVTKESIAEHLWGDFIVEADTFDFIYTHIKNLRKKIENKSGKNRVKTVYGMGYKFE